MAFQKSLKPIIELHQPNRNPPQNHASLSGSTASPAGLLIQCLFLMGGPWEFLRPTKTQPLSWTQKPGTWMLASKAKKCQVKRKIHPQNLSKYETPNQCGKKKYIGFYVKKKMQNRFFTNHFYTISFHLPSKKRNVLEAPIQSYHQIFKVPNRKVEMKTSKMSF